LKDWRRNPLHDWTSHGADALRTFACGYYEPTTSSTNPFRRRPPPPRMGPTGPPEKSRTRRLNDSCRSPTEPGWKARQRAR
jgi:hypothetical protein